MMLSSWSENQFLVNTTEYSVDAQTICPWVSTVSLHTELTEFQENLSLQEAHGEQVGVKDAPCLQMMACHILIMCASTHNSNSCRCRLIKEHLHQYLCLTITPFIPMLYTILVHHCEV